MAQKNAHQTENEIQLNSNHQTDFEMEDNVFKNSHQVDIENTHDHPRSVQLPQPSIEIPDNVSVVNSQVNFSSLDVRLRHNSNRELASQEAMNLRHSHSTSDLTKFRGIYSRTNSRDIKNKSLILPISPTPKSPYTVSKQPPHSLNYTHSLLDGVSLRAVPVNNHPNLHSPLESFSPHVNHTREGVASIYSNVGYTNGAFFHTDSETGSHRLQNVEWDKKKQNRLASASTMESDHKLPTSPETKKKVFSDILSVSLSTIYAILMVTLGVSCFVIDYLDIDDSNIDGLAEGFSLAVIIMSLVYLLYLTIDIAVYTRRKAKFERLMETIGPEHVEIKETSEGVVYDVTVQKALALRKTLDHRYCFNKDRHSNNFYLKIGAAGFCFGHLIHSFLLLLYRGIIINTFESRYTECMSISTLVIEVLYPIYSILLLFFIFKYSNVIINKNRYFHRFGFMHCLSSSLCFWVWTIFRETAEYMRFKKADYDNTESSDVETSLRSIITPMRFTDVCDNDELNIVYQNYSPYLYPFSVEYSILVVGIIYITWENIGICIPNHSDSHDSHGEDTRECMNYTPEEAESNVAIHADCHAANKGLFIGFVVLVFAIVSIIMFFITYNSGSDLGQIGLTITNSIRIAILFLMIIAVLLAYMQMTKLDFNESAHNTLDNFLCLMCLPAFFVFGIFSLIPAILYGQALAATMISAEMIQVLIQTPFIMDGMSRCSNTKELRKQKPGRELVTFLIICNVAMWIMQTFEVKSHGLEEYRSEFYSKELWSIVGHISLPLMMFYRFHSSVCIVDIWKYGYVPAGH